MIRSDAGPWDTTEIGCRPGTSASDMNLVVCIQGDSSSPLEEASLWSILSEFFQRSGASFDTILENVSGWLPGSTPTIFGCACPSWPDGDARTLHVGYLHE